MDVGQVSILITPEILSLVAEVDEFKGRWQALKNLAPDRLTALRQSATIEASVHPRCPHNAPPTRSSGFRTLKTVMVKHEDPRHSIQGGYLE